MLNRLFLFIQLTCLTLLSQAVIAQTSWSLDSCINYALKNNIQVKQSELSIQSAEFKFLQSKAALLPSLNASASQGYNFGRTRDDVSNIVTYNNIVSSGVGLSTQVNLFDGFANYNTIKMNKHDVLSSKYNTDIIKNNISLNIAAKYLEILLNIELAKVAKAQAQQTQKQINRISKLVAAGASTEADLLGIESQYALEDLNVINADNNVELSYLDLIQMLDLDPNTDFKIQSPILGEIISDVIELQPDIIYQKSLQSYPSIKGSEQSLLSKEIAYTIAKARRIPSLSFNASLGTNYSSAVIDFSTGLPVVFGEQFNDNIYEFVGLSLSIPIFNSWSAETNIKYANLNLANAKFELQTEQNNLRKTINLAHANAKAAMKRFAASEIAVKSLKESFRNISKRYDQNIIEFVEYSNAKMNLNKTESDLLQAKYDFIFKVKILDFYQGRPLKF